MPGGEKGAIAELVTGYYHNHIGSRRLRRISSIFDLFDYKVKTTGIKSSYFTKI